MQEGGEWSDDSDFIQSRASKEVSGPSKIKKRQRRKRKRTPRRKRTFTPSPTPIPEMVENVDNEEVPPPTVSDEVLEEEVAACETESTGVVTVETNPLPLDSGGQETVPKRPRPTFDEFEETEDGNNKENTAKVCLSSPEAIVMVKGGRKKKDQPGSSRELEHEEDDTTSAQPLKVETAKHPLAPIGYLNPPDTKDKKTRESVTARSVAREDEKFQPVEWSYVPEVEGMQEVKSHWRDGRGIQPRPVGDLEQEFQIKYSGSTDNKAGRASDLIRQTIMQLIGPNSSPVQEDDESSPELVLTQEDKGLTDEQREELFTVIFTRGGRVPVIGKPDWNIIIHKSPENGIIHLCIEYLSNHKRGFLYKAERLCTKRNCYQNKNTLSSDVLPKCLLHRDRWMYSVATVTDYEERDVLVQIHTKFGISYPFNSLDLDKHLQAQLYVGKNVLHYQTWKDYSDQKKVKNSRLIPKVLSINHFENEEDALKRLSFETTIGMFMKLAPSTPFVNLDNLIPLCHGMEREIDERLKEMGMELKIRRQLTPDEKKVLEYPLGEYLYGSGAVSEQKAEKGKAFLYVIHSRDMWYFGWSDTPGFQNRLKRDEKTDGASMYKKITEERAKLSGMRAPTITCSLLAKCDKKEATKIEAKMIISGYIAYLLGCHNPLRRLPSSQCYSTNKCVSLSLIDSDSWGEIVDFVKFFWGVEPMLAKF